VTVADIDPFADEFRLEQTASLARLRMTSPVAWSSSLGAYLVTSAELVSAILADVETYSNRRSTDALGVPHRPELAAALADIRAGGWPHVPTIAEQDPPWHDLFRSVVAPYFTPTRLRPLTPVVEAISDELIDAWGSRDQIDFVSDFSEPLPLLSIMHVLDLRIADPQSQRQILGRWRNSAVAQVGANRSDDDLLTAERDVVAMQHFLADRLDAADVDEDSVFGALRRARIDDPTSGPRPLEIAEALTVLRQVFVGGTETTTKALAEAFLHLDGDPELFGALASNGNLRRRVVEESLRLSSPAQGILRTVTRDHDLAGVPVKAGDKVFIMFASANRDPAVFADPESFDHTRAGLGHHLAFGRGLHVCLGASLARLEMQVALARLSARIQYRVSSNRPIRYGDGFLLRGPDHVDLDVTYL
jgi:cytochrome P450